MNQVKAEVKVETGAMDNATVEVLVARNAKVAIKTRTLAEVRDMVNVWIVVKAEARDVVIGLRGHREGSCQCQKLEEVCPESAN